MRLVGQRVKLAHVASPNGSLDLLMNSMQPYCPALATLDAAGVMHLEAMERTVCNSQGLLLCSPYATRPGLRLDPHPESKPRFKPIISFDTILS